MSVEPLKVNKRVFYQDSRNVSKPKVNNVEQKVDVKNSINVDELMSKLSNKIDSIQIKNNDLYGENNVSAIDVDFKKELFIDKVDKNAVKSEVIHGKVNNKLDKLKALRKRK
tara:strand:- start:270 stop:605 length:336 start_codon:yes stop_codon:yes gene_type:complete